MEFLSFFHFVLRHKAGMLNKVVDALSHIHAFMAALQAKVIGFEVL